MPSTWQFWIVWNPTGRNPTMRHRSEAEARTEAMRLATAYPGQDFIVMAAVATHSQPPRVIVIEHDSPPF